MNRTEIVRSDGSYGRPLVQSVIIFVCALTFYLTGFFLLVPSNGSDAVTLAIIPVAAAGWLWGWRIGSITGILAAPLSVVLLSMAGPYGWSIFISLGDFIGFSSIALVGGLIGYSRDLNRRANLEIKARQRAEAELRQHRDQLELIVASRTVELKQANERLQQALEREQDLSILKSRFVGMVSHEYRSPLTSILSAVGILRRYGARLSSEQQTDIYRRIEATVHRITQMLDDVLFYKKIEEEAADLVLASVNVATCCDAAIDNARTTLHASQTFSLSNQVSEPYCLTNEAMLRQVLANILSNAVKYSPPDSAISLEINSQDGQLLIQVRDEGVGIPPEEQTRVFQPFYRARNVENIAGTGLGLVISEQIIKRLHGTLTLESTLGTGTNLTIALPGQSTNPSPLDTITP